ncbi:MAG: hypothetical protein DSY81_07120 [Bacillota bacterium]|nr:MAG: hypothetical protein DSY92_10290 [Planctomycetota bacterium]RUA09176.1 MAG: hypothetical protein DSY81_07120 [Bacillota bacterium]
MVAGFLSRGEFGVGVEMINDIPEKLERVGESLASRIPEQLKSAAAIQEGLRQKVLAVARSSQMDELIDHISPPPKMLSPS